MSFVVGGGEWSKTKDGAKHYTDGGENASVVTEPPFWVNLQCSVLLHAAGKPSEAVLLLCMIRLYDRKARTKAATATATTT